MDIKIIWTYPALNDLEDIYQYIAKDSEFYATSFVNEVKTAAKSLSFFANRGRVIPEFGNDSIREIFIKKYRLIYQYKDNTVYILSFIHGARDLS